MVQTRMSSHRSWRVSTPVAEAFPAVGTEAASPRNHMEERFSSSRQLLSVTQKDRNCLSWKIFWDSFYLDFPFMDLKILSPDKHSGAQIQLENPCIQQFSDIQRLQ